MQVATKVVGVMQENCHFVISQQNHCAIIDPGDEAELLISYMHRNRLMPVYILLTHAHFDHIGAVNEIKKAFPDIKVAVSKQDQEMLRNINLNLAYMAGGYRDKYIVDSDILLTENTVLTMDELTFTFLLTPGHTKGSMCIFCKDHLFTGDTLFHLSIGRTDFPGGDPLEMKRSLKKLAQIKGDYTIYPGHGENSGLVYEKKNNMFLGRV